MSAPSLVCASLEVALNRYLRLEPTALRDCAALADDSIELQLAGFDWTFFIEFYDGGVRVLNERAQAPSVRLRGPLPAFARMALKAAGGDHALPRDLSVEGDAQVLQRFRQLLGRVGVDFEELLAPLLGGGAAHRAAQGLKSLFTFGRSSTDTLMQNTAEYLREETRDLARGVDVDDWMNEVDRLRDGVDRIEARLARFERRAGAR